MLKGDLIEDIAHMAWSKLRGRKIHFAITAWIPGEEENASAIAVAASPETNRLTVQRALTTAAICVFSPTESQPTEATDEEQACHQ